MKTVLHKENTRGAADHGWLRAKHSFSFGGWYNPDRVHFGALRVLNDDYIAGGKGFGRHPHDNMEIITIPMSGQLEHKDSMGNTGIISKGEVQVMSAGTGIEHSEYNHNSDEPVTLFQVWIISGKRNVKPRYDQRAFDFASVNNSFITIVSPMGNDEARPDDPVGRGYEPTVTVTTKKSTGKILISVADNGNGIPQKVVDKIFQPFFTTKPTGEGTGLGLSLSYDIVKAHGGELKVETKEGEGTIFAIILSANSII